MCIPKHHSTLVEGVFYNTHSVLITHIILYMLCNDLLNLKDESSVHWATTALSILLSSLINSPISTWRQNNPKHEMYKKFCADKEYVQEH